MRSKFLSFILFAVFFAAIITPAVNASNAPKKSLSYRQAEINYINGVESDNAGLRLSSTLFLGEMKSDEAVIPLMRVLKNCDDEACRIAAALALTKIGDSRGIYAVKKAATYDESPRVRELSWKFYMSTVKTGAVRF
ncbi:hypothetical protein MASR2M39_21150 [Ignavibacteriales bacterium]